MNYVIIPALIGPMVGPFAGGLIVHWLHWRMIFFVNLPFAAGGLWLVFNILWQDHKSKLKSRR
jgi:MFS family permease